MVFLVLTPSGLQQALQAQEASSISIWCGSDAISETDFEALGRRGLTRFDYPLANETLERLQDTFDTITEHHPNEAIYVEYIPQH
jgi:hypothetical protein